MTDQQTFDIPIDARAYRYIRQTSVRNVQDGVVELITNSVDAYNKKISQNPVSLDPASEPLTTKVIDIEIYNGKSVVVRDYAIGLSGEDMVKCFLQVGNFTSHEGARGYFSRGAKDISALGDVTFETIKNGAYSACRITYDAKASVLVMDETKNLDQRRQNTGIKENGLLVTIDLNVIYNIIDDNQLIQVLRTHCSLRDILSDHTNNITIQFFNNGEPKHEKTRLIYDYPDSTLLLDITYTVPKYPDAIARFILNKSRVSIFLPPFYARY